LLPPELPGERQADRGGHDGDEDEDRGKGDSSRDLQWIDRRNPEVLIGPPLCIPSPFVGCECGTKGEQHAQRGRESPGEAQSEIGKISSVLSLPPLPASCSTPISYALLMLRPQGRRRGIFGGLQMAISSAVALRCASKGDVKSRKTAQATTQAFRSSRSPDYNRTARHRRSEHVTRRASDGRNARNR
jgi:hypothetical protein